MRAKPVGRRLRVPRHLPSAVSLAFKTEVAPTESLFGRWTRYCARLQVGGKEAAAWLRDGPPDPSTSPAWIEVLAKLWKHDLCIQMGRRQDLLHAAALMSLSSDEFAAATLFDLSPTDVHKKNVAREPLRACWRCMRLAFHSAIFQHPALARCALHRCLLTSECPSCSEALWLDLRAAAASPFACRKCGALWPKSVMTAQDESERVLAGTLLDRHRQEIAPLAYSGFEHTKMWTANAHPVQRCLREEMSVPAQISRSIARWCAWPLDSGQAWGAMRYECCQIEDWDPKGVSRKEREGLMPRTMQAATASLHRLFELCMSSRLDMALLRLVAGLRPRGMVLPDCASPIALALHLTMQAYAAQLPGAETKSTEESPYGDVVWNGRSFDRGIPESDQATSILLPFEIAGYFAWCLLRTRNAGWATQARWSAPEPAAAYLPAWIVKSSSNGKALQFRARTSHERLPRLIRRFSAAIPLTLSPRGYSTDALREAWKSLRECGLQSEVETADERWLRDLAQRIAETRHPR